MKVHVDVVVLANVRSDLDIKLLVWQVDEQRIAGGAKLKPNPVAFPCLEFWKPDHVASSVGETLDVLVKQLGSTFDNIGDVLVQAVVKSKGQLFNVWRDHGFNIVVILAVLFTLKLKGATDSSAHCWDFGCDVGESRGDGLLNA